MPLLRAPRCLTFLLLACVSSSFAQYRGGSIHWEPVAPGSHTVKFTLRTVWERSAGVYTKLVDGIPQVFAGAGMYQPVQGDRIKVLGPETPKFIVSNGLFREYLELTVTYNTEQVSKGDPTGTNLPHAAPHWSYEGTNWFEGITEWEVELPDSEKTYVAELQGCCRVNQMAHMQSNQGCIETMYGRGVLQLCETPFFLRSTINLQYIPPPVSFLPQMLAYSFLREDGTLLEPLVLPILDYRATRKGMVRIPEQPMTWPEKIRTEEEDAGGILYKLAPIVVENPPEVEPVAVRRQSATSESSFSRSSRHLLAGHLGDEEVPVDLEPLPKFPTPPANKIGVNETFYKVYTSASGTGVSLRMLDIEPSQHLTLYSSLSCGGHELRIPPGSDVCDHSFVPMYDCEHGQGRVAVEKCFEGSSSRVTGNVHSIMVPAGLTVHFSDKCESSDPYALDTATILGQCDNAMGASGMCCNVTSAHVRTFRASKPSGATKCIQQSAGCPKDLTKTLSIHEALRIDYSAVSKEGVVSTLVYRPPTPRELMEGNYPVTLMIGTKSSGITMVEFILKVGPTSLGASQVIPEIHMGATNIPTNFEYQFGWEFTGEMSSNGNIFFQTVDDGGYLFGSSPSVVNLPFDGKNPNDAADDVVAHGTFKWTPCLADAGLYYYCMSAVSIPAKDTSGSIYRWSDAKCVMLRVVEDLPPKLSFYYKDTPFHDQDMYHLYMGQRLEAVVNASDNFQDTIDILGISKITLNTGDELRARVTYVYENVDKAYKEDVAKMPRLVQLEVPSYANLYVGGPVNETIAKMRKHQMDKIISYTPTRMHSGLEMEVCFLAVDNRGTCSKLGDWAERCMKVFVYRCKYSMQVGEDLTNVAGLFQQNWMQLFALNPTYTTPESAVATKDTLINVGHLYTVREGENVYDLMRRFGMSKKDMLFVNADLSRQTEESWAKTLAVGMQLCLVPSSCGTHV